MSEVTPSTFVMQVPAATPAIRGLWVSDLETLAHMQERMRIKEIRRRRYLRMMRRRR